MFGKAIHWFRQDLRLSDNPALSEANLHSEVFPIYILDNHASETENIGAASQWWLHHSLTKLDQQLGGKLSVFVGDPGKILTALVKRNEITHVFWNRCYEPWRVSRDKKIKELLEKQGTFVQTKNGSLLWEPWRVLKKDGSPYKVFTPFYKRACQDTDPPRQPLAAVDIRKSKKDVETLSVDSLNLLPKTRWYDQIEALWNPGERGAKKALNSFLSCGLAGYQLGRDFPVRENISKLSPHLHFGELSPNEVWYSESREGILNCSSDDGVLFCRQLIWREFSYNLLYFFKDLPEENFKSKFDRFPWVVNQNHLKSWKQGNTGIPFIDAGMRELWQTGHMHNRVRMIAASFLVKNLLIDWREGQKWFWDCLLDADLASNSAGWQWVAGSGVDAAPYFRIFNPVSQGKKYDLEGLYIRKFVPELSQMPNEFIHDPWNAPPEILEKANVILGQNYSFPLVDLKESRQRALSAYSQIKGAKNL
tara:strand:- start:118 stop:1551 length:1434 start_codon:yes stop_codon:yes gene_type:complete